MDEETIEIHAVKMIKDYLNANTSIRLSQRRKHMLKLELKSAISRWRHDVDDVNKIPLDAINMVDMVQYAATRRIVD